MISTHGACAGHCLSGGESHGAAWCGKAWCYVDKSCFDTHSVGYWAKAFRAFHSDYATNLYYSYEQCEKTNGAPQACTTAHAQCNVKGQTCKTWTGGGMCVDTDRGKVAGKDANGNIIMFECPEGTIAPTKNSHKCVYCDPGKFNGIPGGHKCTSSSLGHVPNWNRTEEDSCGPGGYMDQTNGGKCDPCGGHAPAGCSQCGGDSEVVVCKTCESGKYAKHAANTKCTCASEGNVPNKDKTDWEPCGAGTYQDQPCGDSCKTCDTGKYSTHAVNVNCTCALPGYVANSGRTQHEACGCGTKRALLPCA